LSKNAQLADQFRDPLFGTGAFSAGVHIK
jgi:hypothetical protein